MAVISKVAKFDEPLDRQIAEVVEALKNADLLTLKLRSLSTYANNAAALSGGLTAGQVYKTSTGVLMVVY